MIQAQNDHHQGGWPTHIWLPAIACAPPMQFEFSCQEKKNKHTHYRMKVLPCQLTSFSLPILYSNHSFFFFPIDRITLTWYITKPTFSKEERNTSKLQSHCSFGIANLLILVVFIFFLQSGPTRKNLDSIQAVCTIDLLWFNEMQLYPFLIFLHSMSRLEVLTFCPRPFSLWKSIRQPS